MVKVLVAYLKAGLFFQQTKNNWLMVREGLKWEIKKKKKTTKATVYKMHWKLKCVDLTCVWGQTNELTA